MEGNMQDDDNEQDVMVPPSVHQGISSNHTTQLGKFFKTDQKFSDPNNFAEKSVYFTDEVKIKIENEEKFVNEFKILNNIGKGSFSKVKKVLRKWTDSEIGEQKESGESGDIEKYFAMKMMHKPLLSKQRAMRFSATGEMEMINYLDNVYNEVEVWAQISHPNIIKMYEIIDADEHDYLYLILELADYGQLARWDFEKETYVRQEKIIECILSALEQNDQRQPAEVISDVEQVARYIFHRLAQALIYLHNEAGIIHKDIKLDNILFDSTSCDVKLSDFTVSRSEIDQNTKLFDCEGTPSFTAPECTVVDKDGYFPRPADIWSYGVCLYTFVAGIVPFYGDCELQIQINTRQKELECPPEFSNELKDLLGLLLNKDPSLRPTALDMLEHPWFTQAFGEQNQEANPEEQQQENA